MLKLDKWHINTPYKIQLQPTETTWLSQSLVWQKGWKFEPIDKGYVLFTWTEVSLNVWYYTLVYSEFFWCDLVWSGLAVSRLTSDWTLTIFTPIDKENTNSCWILLDSSQHVVFRNPILIFIDNICISKWNLEGLISSSKNYSDLVWSPTRISNKFPT